MAIAPNPFPARRNPGAVARNVAVRQVGTSYVAFCDDDTWWEPGSLGRCADALDAHPDVASVTARIIVEPSEAEDPINAELANSPVPGRPGLPGPALMSLLAGASVLRVAPFREAGGFSPRLWLGGEEEPLAADLIAAGHVLCYLPEAVVRHAPSVQRDPTRRRWLASATRCGPPAARCQRLRRAPPSSPARCHATPPRWPRSPPRWPACPGSCATDARCPARRGHDPDVRQVALRLPRPEVRG